MSNFYIGTQRPNGIYVGTNSVKAVYLGTEKVWEANPEIRDYVEIYSIKADTNQYIRTGYHHNANTEIEIEFLPRKKNQWNALIGARTATQKTDTWSMFFTGNRSDGKGYVGLNTSKANLDTIALVELYEEHTVNLTASTITIDGTPYSTGVSTIGTTTLEDCVCATNHNNSIIDKMCGDILSLKITDGQNIIRNYVPVRSMSGTNIGLLDTANDVLYESASGTSFVIGNPTKFNSIYELNYFQGGMSTVEYLSSNNSQYINTHYHHNQNTVIEMEFYSETGLTYSGLFGSRSGTSKADTWDVYYTNGYIGMNTSTINNDRIAPLSSNERHTIRITATTLTVDDIDYSIGSEIIGDAIYEDYLFGFSTGYTSQVLSKTRIYWCKIYDGQTLVKNYVPKKSANGTSIGMYDTINKELFESESSNPFIAGEII